MDIINLCYKQVSFLGRQTACSYVLRTKLQQFFYKIVLILTSDDFGIDTRHI